MKMDTKNVELKNTTKKINLSHIKEESKSNYYESSKSEGYWVVQNQIMMNLQFKAQRTSEFMKSIF